ncbi:prefoldin subunit 1-like isoform X1 [Penaeus japonicus]|uniref:prefoldin subunit 1-like isoform X1 n=1 Tax=Penaeus japonicus TaxID=27405 RepID=UPI001C711ABC|nr:prefoldin subunit 1-like isoform X1 [Penaeus japonicus]
MSKEPDQELKKVGSSMTLPKENRKAFMELQGKMQETNQKLRIADVQVESLKKQIVHAQLTDKEIQSLGDSTRVYDSVGRMFLLTDIPQIRENLKAKVEKCNEKITSLQANKEYLERSMSESQNNLREMIKLKQSMGVA